ncbi:PREDICTED: interferon omega-1-like [Crocodylus porosus]|uniref:interferon omega-1-like n=1 Tax=Crocodylus porosus TaxID=8502 RepID=UPI00093E1634|nr:PREDICTED: interferon omega-1-like [Crocodylus porosus]
MACISIRAWGGLWQICLAALLLARVTALDCSNFKDLQEVLNRNSMQLLGQVAGALPEECLEDRPTFRFPEKVLRSKAPHNAWMASYEILQQLFSLFKGNLPETAWDMHSVERFLNAVHVQIKRLETCLPTNRLYPRSQNKAMKLKKYFRNIHNFLREKNYSKCAWEVVRIEAKTWFYYLDKFGNRL